jgi:hypothetical protein
MMTEIESQTASLKASTVAFRSQDDLVNRKVWGGNRDVSGARTQETVTSVLRTCRQQGRDPLTLLMDGLRSRVPMVAPAHCAWRTTVVHPWAR